MRRWAALLVTPLATGLASCGVAEAEASAPAYSVQVDYMLQCQGCHLPNGEGFPANDVPKLAGEISKFLNVEGGRDYLVQVPGAASSDLSDERLANVLNWMVQEFSPSQVPADFKPYDAAEVARLRARPLLETRAARAALITKVSAWEAGQTRLEARRDPN
ncbi:MAG: cytochrome c [Pseudomonadota bacterium]